uniref:Uncharacterized protein n=1 Tax=Parascaris univalens TaxID=6257 RepID=A0A915AUP3_PARUN
SNGYSIKVLMLSIFSHCSEQVDTSVVAEMDRLNALTIPDFGIHNDDIHYLFIDSVISGRGPDRLKYLDLEGRWRLSGRSVPYITAAFKHLERFNDAKQALRMFTDEPLNAVGLRGWAPSEEPEKKQEKAIVVIRPESEFKEQLPPSPREAVPHRSAGYGPAHQKRKFSVPERTSSPARSAEAFLITDYDKYAKYQTKDSSLQWGSKGDLGYVSADERNGLETPSPRINTIRTGNDERPPLRTQTLMNEHNGKWRQSNASERKSTKISRDRHYADDLTISVKETTKRLPYRSGGYGSPHLLRQYDISPRSNVTTDYSSASEQTSPYNRNVDGVLVTTYHMTKTMRRQRTQHRAESNVH